MRLVVVESPAKARTIAKFLPGNEYRVEACMGHVRDLPPSAAEMPDKVKDKSVRRLGVDVEDDFKPVYIIPKSKKKVVADLRKALKNADELFVATDEDREGESIGWHLIEVLKPTVPVRRMVFHEITKSAIEAALQDTRELDQNLVESQETRRVLDRLVGYEISPVLWRKISRGLSAGRVQSAAVRLLVMRETDRILFKKGSYWDLAAALDTNGRAFEAVATHIGDQRIATGRDFDDETGRLKSKDSVLLLDESGARHLAESFVNGKWTISSVDKQNKKSRPYPPFITSSLQQEGNRKLGLSARDTMRTAQDLYEKGLITYMRTDSVQLSNEAIEAARNTIRQRYGVDYVSPSPRKFKSSQRNAQEAHEAIRPAGTEMRSADELRLSGREHRLYDLIWKRTVASQMADARQVFTTVRIEVDGADGTIGTFRASGKQTEFPGYFRAYVEGKDDPDAALEDQEKPLPPLREGMEPGCEGVKPSPHETKAPSRFTDASLVRELERLGIGRPSTYAKIIDTIVDRGYSRRKGNQLIPTFTAFATNNLLQERFNSLVDLEFTAKMEEALDEIADGSREASPYLRSFYHGDGGLKHLVEKGLDEIDPKTISTLRFEDWNPFVIRVGKFGPYVEGEIEGETATASLPSDIAPDEITPDYLRRLIEDRQTQGKPLAVLPETGESILLREGRFGPYLQLGEGKGDEKPKRVSIPKGLNPDDIDEDKAIALISLPRNLGPHPKTGNPVEAAIGRYGPYVKHDRTFASLPKTIDVLKVTHEQAIPLIDAKEAR
ncbi:MAG: type I DNA topoisomerase, partial [Rhodothermia bacterium]